MTNEPVAYLVSQEPYSSARYIVCDKPIPIGNEKITPLYTKEQLQHRVKMTKLESDEFELLYKLFHGSTVRGVINTVEYNESKRFMNLKSRLNKMGKDLELIVLWDNYDPEKPEETIEIVPTMKWFVERNDTNDDYRFLSKNVINLDNELNYAALKKSAKQFVTKKEAEEWTNPLTEAVLLPVE